MDKSTNGRHSQNFSHTDSPSLDFTLDCNCSSSESFALAIFVIIFSLSVQEYQFLYFEAKSFKTLTIQSYILCVSLSKLLQQMLHLLSHICTLQCINTTHTHKRAARTHAQSVICRWDSCTCCWKSCNCCWDSCSCCWDSCSCCLLFCCTKANSLPRGPICHENKSETLSQHNLYQHNFASLGH